MNVNIYNYIYTNTNNKYMLTNFHTNTYYYFDVSVFVQDVCICKQNTI